MIVASQHYTNTLWVCMRVCTSYTTLGLWHTCSYIHINTYVTQHEKIELMGTKQTCWHNITYLLFGKRYWKSVSCIMFPTHWYTSSENFMKIQLCLWKLLHTLNYKNVVKSISLIFSCQVTYVHTQTWTHRYIQTCKMHYVTCYCMATRMYICTVVI